MLKSRRQFQKESKLNVNNLKSQEIVDEIQRIQQKKVKKIGDHKINKVAQSVMNNARSEMKEMSLLQQLNKYQGQLRNGKFNNNHGPKGIN